MAIKKQLIDANDVYALFGANGMATLHVGVIDIIPRVDAAPVVYGQWRWGQNAYKQHGAWCNRCGCGWEYKPGDFDRIQGLVNAHKYCPNCGAKMDGAKDG